MTDRQKCSMEETVRSPNDDFAMVFWDGQNLSVGGRGIGLRARLRIDDKPVMESSRCVGGLCVFSGRQAALAVSQMRTGQRLLVEFTRTRGSVGPAETSLSGFDEAYRKMRGK
jgi:hypothetical protein